MKQNYMTRLSRAARWALPRQEADSVLEDYQEMLRENPRSEEVLYKELGEPGQAVKLLIQPKSYGCWLVVFVLLELCLFLPLSAACSGRMEMLFHRIRIPMAETLQVLGTAVAFLWFQREGVREQNGTRPNGLLPLLLLPALGLVTAWIFASWVPGGLAVFFRLQELTDGAFSGRTIGWILEFHLLAAFLLGTFGLVKARIGDRRWRALFVLCLTSAFLNLAIMLLLSNMDLSATTDLSFWWGEALKYIFITAFGLVGTGVSLY